MYPLTKHINCKDVAFQPQTKLLVDGGMRLVGYWVNIVNPNNHYTIDSDTIYVKLEDIDKWKEVR